MCFATMNVPLLLAHEADVELTGSRSCLQALAFVITPDRFCWNFQGRYGATHFIDVVRSDCLRTIFQWQWTCQVKSLRCAAGGLIKIVLFLEQSGGRNIFKGQAIVFQTLALFM